MQGAGIKMEIPVQKERRLDDGVHTGRIVEVNFREKPYEYTDVVIELADKFKVTVGYPTMITPTTKLGKLLSRFGVKLEIGQNVDPEKELMAQYCTFQSITDEDSKYYKILPESVKPAKEVEP